ncbi:hypothetical protein AB5I39_14765 [Sphingomonas sp. MMS24-J45]|uniref:hypothetical protein n=1 Tax=Sphingomonas sp. MMS24-J45 TaxID=3238806 RepID=UPI0038515788
MLVSQFELVYKPQSPVPPADVVLQGYFLEISNLEDKPYQFTLDFITSSITDVDRSLFGNTVVFIDVPGANNQSGVYSLTGALAAKKFSLNKRFEIPAQGTALVALLPSDPFSMPGNPPPTPNFECRGYVNLRLPTVGTIINPKKQSVNPVKVMLTPQNRATYFAPGGAINDQTQSSLPLAGGSAVVDVPSDTPITIFDATDIVLVPNKGFVPEVLVDGLTLIEELMVAVAEAPDGVAKVNAVLAKKGMKLALDGRAPSGAKRE